MWSPRSLILTHTHIVKSSSCLIVVFLLPPHMVSSPWTATSGNVPAPVFEAHEHKEAGRHVKTPPPCWNPWILHQKIYIHIYIHMKRCIHIIIIIHVCIIYMSGGQNYLLLAMDMAKVGCSVSVVKVCTSMLCVKIGYRQVGSPLSVVKVLAQIWTSQVHPLLFLSLANFVSYSYIIYIYTYMHIYTDVKIDKYVTLSITGDIDWVVSGSSPQQHCRVHHWRVRS